MKNKSIVLISNLYPNCNETTKGLFIKQLADSLNRKTKICVIAPLPFNPFEYIKSTNSVPKQETIDGIKVYHPRYIVIPKLFRSLTGYFFYFGIKGLLKKLQADNLADVISAHWVYPDGFSATLAAKKLNIPIAVHGLGCDINEYTKYKLRRQLIVKALTNSNINIVKSQALKNKINELGVTANKTHVIHNGVDQSKFKRFSVDEARTILDLRLNEKYCLFVGNFQIEKGLDYLIKAIGIIRKENFKLLIIGSGPLENNLKSLVNELELEDKIIFLGRKEHSLIPKYLAAADLLCLPSLREGCPNVVLESLSCGTPVVASNVGAVPDIISSNEFGVIVPPEDPNALAEGIRQGLAISKADMPKFDWYDWNENAQIILDKLNNLTTKSN